MGVLIFVRLAYYILVNNKESVKYMEELLKLIMMNWATFGCRVEKYEEDDEFITLYISVPEDGYAVDVCNKKLSGKSLAKRFKENLDAFPIQEAKPFFVKSRIRTGEFWTGEMAEAEVTNLEQLLSSLSNE